jgi:hypothetical protein
MSILSRISFPVWSQDTILRGDKAFHCYCVGQPSFPNFQTWPLWGADTDRRQRDVRDFHTLLSIMSRTRFSTVKIMNVTYGRETRERRIGKSFFHSVTLLVLPIIFIDWYRINYWRDKTRQSPYELLLLLARYERLIKMPTIPRNLPHWSASLLANTSLLVVSLSKTNAQSNFSSRHCLFLAAALLVAAERWRADLDAAFG